MADTIHDFQAETPDLKPKEQWHNGNLKHAALVAAEAVVVIAIIVAILFFFVIGISKVDGNSMYPTYKNGDKVWFLRVGDHTQRGDIISIKMPSGEHYVKRIVALPGDSVEVRDGSFIVNGKVMDEPYAKGQTLEQDGEVIYPLVIPKNKYFVLGDNRTGSIDSRTFGPIAEAQIEGKILGQK